MSECILIAVSIWSEIRPAERRVAVAAFLTLFGILASHTVLETARDALFLARLPASQLPFMYLGMAAVAVAMAQVPARPLRRMLGRYGLQASLVSMAAVTAAFWAFPGSRGDWGLRALYIWGGLFGTLSALQLWLALGEIVTITQAKRLYQFVGVGSLLGAVAGGLVARAVSTQFSASALIPTSALLALATALGPAIWLRQPEERAGETAAPLRWTLREARTMIAEQPYVTRLAGLMLVATVALTLADYVFKSEVAATVPKEQLGLFFATFNAALSALGLVAQLWLMGVLLRQVGLNRALWALPILLSLGALGVALGGGLAAALFLKAADGTLRYSVHKTGMELLFLPIPETLRARVKPAIDVFGQRGGQAIASIFILSELVMGRGDSLLALAAAVLCVVWIATAVELTPHYVQMFRAALRHGSLREPAGMPELDLNSLEVLFAALNSPDDTEVIAAMDLLVAEGRAGLIPALILYHPSKSVVLGALEVFERSGRSDFVPIADRLLTHADAELRAAALRARIASHPQEALLRRALGDESPLVAATAAVGLLAGGWDSDASAAPVEALLRAGGADARAALARAIERHPAAAFEKTLVELAASPERETQVAVAAAMARLQKDSFLEPLLWMLSRHEVRKQAGHALVSFGASGLAFLAGALADASFPHELRRQIPRTISRFPARDAARVLQARLLEERDGMVRFKILRALNRLSARNPSLVLDRPLLQAAAARTIEAVLRLRHWQRVLVDGRRERPERNTPGHELLATLLGDKQAHAVERLFRLLGLLHRGENFESIYRGLLSSSARLSASSRELIENVLRPPLRQAVLAAVDDGPADARLADIVVYYKAPALAYEELLRLLLEESSETLRCLAAHHAAELRLSGLRAAIDERRSRETELFAGRALEKALRVLDGPAQVQGVAG